ncbi:Heat shock factor binding 1 [Ascosphaera apis ARSEF 7405]|uniref:Heat shock factor binding 1 n=1 Tax=Ascosphaera apis ARSEF 7405 TaxID=392613 RepID=A0A168A6P2_9EURO|nr:Heat shock factor binding 1 [Ascosphaera apis ARSEF 7405]
MSSASRSSREIASPAATRSSLIPHTASTEENGTHQLAVAVDDLLDQLQQKFDKVSAEIFTKMDDMSRRLDALENSLAAANDGDKN